MLTPDERRALEWIRDNHSHTARWLIDGKKPGPGQGVDDCNQLELVSDGGSIRISDAVVSRCTAYVKPGDGRRIFALTEAGEAALA